MACFFSSTKRDLGHRSGRPASDDFDSYDSDDFDSCFSFPDPPFNNNNSFSSVDVFQGRSRDLPFNNNNSYNTRNFSALQQQKKKRRHIFSWIGQKSSSNNNLDLKGHVMVKVRTTPVDIITLENNNRIIPEEEAVCRFCFHQLFLVNNDHNINNVLKTKCLCPFTLTHDHCATEWSRTKGNTKCDVCDQNTNYIPVTLSTTSQEKSDKVSSISTLKKWSCFSTD